VLEKLPQLGVLAEVSLILEAQLHLWAGARAGGRAQARRRTGGGRSADVSCRQGQRCARARCARGRRAAGRASGARGRGARGGVARTFFSLSRTCCSSESTSMGSNGVYVAAFTMGEHEPPLMRARTVVLQ
jgi:hypothetical protein